MLNSLKGLLRVPVINRNSKVLAKLIEVIRQLKYFRKIAETFGNKILYEYCKYLQMTHISAGCTLSPTQNLLILIDGKIIVRDKLTLNVINQYQIGSQLKKSDQTIQFYANQQSFLIVVKEQYLYRLHELQKRAYSHYIKRLEIVKNNSDLTQILQSFRHSSLFKDLSLYDLIDITHSCKVKIYKKGDVIYEQQHYPQYLYYLLKGQVAINHRQTKQQNLNKYTNIKRLINKLATSIVNINQIFGIQQILQNKRYECQAVAFSTDVKIATIEIEVFQQKINRNYTTKILEHLQNLIQTKKKITQKFKISKRQKQKLYEQNMQIANAKKYLKQRINSVQQNKTIQKSSFIRSNKNTLPYRCYLPVRLNHKNKISEIKLNGSPKKLELGLYSQQAIKKKYTMQNFSRFSRTLSKLPQHKYIYERAIISKLEQYDSIDQIKHLQETTFNNDKGSTINFFRRDDNNGYKKNRSTIYDHNF